MPPYDDWNKIDEEEDEELQDFSLYESRRDVILFCIDCSESMLELRDDPNYDNAKTCNLFTALEAAMQIQRKKVIAGPNDSVGILLFNTTRQTASSRNQGSEIKKNTFLNQPIGPLSAPTIQQLIRLLDDFREDPTTLQTTFPPLAGKRIPMGDVFTSCNWVIRDGAPKTATKRVFLITDEDDPHPGQGSQQLLRSARTTLIDLTTSGVTVEPFFISTADKPFDVSKFYSSVLLPNNLIDEDDVDPSDPSVLPESISITRIDDLLAQMRFHEVPKRASFSVPFELAKGFTIGIKGYGLVTEQKKGVYKYFVDLGDRMEVANARTVYVDEAQQEEAELSKILYGMSLGAPSTRPDDDDDDDDDGKLDGEVRIVKAGNKPFFTAEDVRSFRTMGLEPGIKLLGFKDRDELAFEDSIKHSLFIYPDELSFSGSKRTFSALLKAMIKKKKMGLALVLARRNSSPTFCALLPQEEKIDETGWKDPAGFHLIPLPFADDIRAATVEKGARASDDLKDAARAWIDKLSVKNGAYPPDSYPNPGELLIHALAYHNAQLEATAFREEFNPDEFEDLTLPKAEMIHKRAGKLMEAWKHALVNDESADYVPEITKKPRKKVNEDSVKSGTKRKAEQSVDEAELRSMYDAGTLMKMRVDQLKDFLKSKSQPVSGKKADLVERVAEFLDAH